MADGLAEQGYLVIVAKLLVTAGKPGTDGDALAPDETFNMDWIKTFPWTVQKPKVEAALAHLKKRGAQKIGVMGFCYGGHPACWASRELSKEYAIEAGVVLHPSMQLEKFAFGGDLAALLGGVTCPFMLAPAGNDMENWAEEHENGGCAISECSHHPSTSDAPPSDLADLLRVPRWQGRPSRGRHAAPSACGSRTST